MKRALGFAAAMGVLIALTAWACTYFFKGPMAMRAIVMSAGVAFTVQLLTFTLARAIIPTNLMAGWGAGMLVRFVTLAVHGFVGIPILGLQMDAALVSLAAFFFLTTLIEPLFLGRPSTTVHATQ